MLSQNLKRLFHHMTLRRRWQALGLTALMLVGALAEMATLGAVVPFLALLADPGMGSKYPQFLAVLSVLGPAGLANPLAYAAALFAIIAVSGALVRLLLSWATYRFTFGLGADLSSAVFARTLHQPYSWHVRHNSSEILAGVNKVNRVVSGIINPLVQGAVGLILAISIFAILVGIDARTASVAAVGFALFYAISSRITRRTLKTNSGIISRNETRVVQAVQEGLGGIRDILLDSSQAIYLERFGIYNGMLRRAQATNSFIASAPRFLIEAMGMVLIVALAYWLHLREGGLTAAIPVLGALAIGAQKLMPQMQLIYAGWAAMTGNSTALSEVLGLLEQPVPSSTGPATWPANPLHIRPEVPVIRLRDVGFRYNDEGPDVLDGFNLAIRRGARIGFVGKTGSGKSTLIDVIMGLLEPTRGQIEIDGTVLTPANLRAWQSRIAHVPQFIYIADTTIARNIAFGIERASIDMERVREAARKARIAEYIETLPGKYDEVVGERGVRFSGGQRQRLGIARALYKQADILVLDEATSALDDATEKSVMSSVENIGREITILMVAHRLSTLQNCDQLIEL